ncbi:glycoside hydrolase family 32 protein [Microbacterium capsulatum]|uniref:Glycoside hydrolase family 32 protein n=1 Tax=Microbacterium capsulatum TaxID=3041921 RepID=A0ABU0XFP5_9MICO|nr:glycoside hydrolase family 32 protein [Microbacterium sp. ASV81]MDQ4213876.1 glycoside hydrolase family 32 protein [Microbacterium sp. ASV81]
MIERPLIHFTPARNWMNDPNGLVFHEGRYHLFFQYNPHGPVHANMSWGHATSRDLVRWQEHPVAIPADENEQIFSGSVVVDNEGTSGFAAEGETALVAVYTSVDAQTSIQSQALAYSVDDGMTWTKYAGNPVLDRGSLAFRDPKVFRYEGPAGAYWVMVAVEAGDRQVMLYRSDDLRSWSFLSAYGPAGAVGGEWECPDLFPLSLDGDPDDVRWVMVISLNPGGIAGGSGTQYVVGDFDGVTFTPERPVSDTLTDVDWVDFGSDCYAGVTFNGLPQEERTFIAWMGNWDYARLTPAETSPWRGAMTLARRLSLATVDGRPQLCADPILREGAAVDPAAELPPVARIRAGVRLGGAPGAALHLEVAGADGQATVRCDAESISVHRSGAGSFVRPGGSVESAPLAGDAEAIDLTIVVDTGSIEVFDGSGTRSITDLVAFGDGRRLTVRAAGGAVAERLEVVDLWSQS